MAAGALAEAQTGPGPVAPRKRFLSRAARVGAAIVAYSLAGVVGWLLYGLVAPHYAGWPDFIAAKFARMSAAPVDLLPVTQKMEAEIQALQTKVEALEKARNADHEVRAVARRAEPAHRRRENRNQSRDRRFVEPLPAISAGNEYEIR